MSKKNIQNADDNEWGNIELPGFPDSKLLSPNINHTIANMENARDPEWQRKQKAGIRKKSKTKEWKRNQLEGTRTIRANGTWRKNVAAGAVKRERENKFDRKALNKKTFASKKWKDAVKEGCADRWEQEVNRTVCEHCHKDVDNANYKKWHGDNCKHAKPRELIVCPHCGFSGTGTVMKRWHFDNCKQK